ncbi:hypothetical protein [Nevskia sp.]|uniref:hypothetical protein n=1 Tax=Nevskia sp. TaxID=1929292 RepID=UPI0025E49662|nr:hypothetical protein [Nevskia sp.]
MSTVKSPQDKKQLSYELDRRNVYGENHKSSIKNIRRAKQHCHMSERRVATQILSSLAGDASQHRSEITQLDLAERMQQRKLKSFKKSPDAPLGQVVAKKLARRANHNESA